MSKRIILDADPGIDDSLVILLALASPEISLEGLSIVHGNCSLEQATPAVSHGSPDGRRGPAAAWRANCRVRAPTPVCARVHAKLSRRIAYPAGGA